MFTDHLIFTHSSRRELWAAFDTRSIQRLSTMFKPKHPLNRNEFVTTLVNALRTHKSADAAGELFDQVDANSEGEIRHVLWGSSSVIIVVVRFSITGVGVDVNFTKNAGA